MSIELNTRHIRVALIDFIITREAIYCSEKERVRIIIEAEVHT